MHIEYGPGQFEFTCQPKFGLQTADETFTLRQAVSSICLLSFMCKVLCITYTYSGFLEILTSGPGKFA